MNNFESYFNTTMKSCQEQLKNNDNLVIMYDLESGFPYVVTKEYRDSYIKFLEDIIPKSNIKLEGKIIMFGTGGSIDNNEFENIFKKG